MAEGIRRRRRRRKIGELIKPEEQKQVLPVEENSAERRANDERRRSRRVSSSLEPEEPKPSLTEESISKTETEEITSQVTRKGILVMRQGIDEIRAELGEERNSALLESDYWDETHSWGADDEEASDEYWHFVGRYE